MSSTPISSYAHPDPTLTVRQGAPQISRPTKEEIAAFPAEAKKLLGQNWAAQKPLLEAGHYNLNWLEGRHILLAGATGPGLGGALATAVMGVGTAASVTVIGRDLSRSLGFETGKAMQKQADLDGWASRFHWLNDGMGLEGKPLKKIMAALKGVVAEDVVYFNTVAAANSGLLPGLPPVFVKDVDETGLFQWELTPLDERAITATKFVMGEMAVQFPGVLEQNNISVGISVFADWRGSLDKASRDPNRREYGRQGAYSTSLYLPKDIVQDYTRSCYGTKKRAMNIFYPMMRTRALPFIPGGMTTANINQTLMTKEGIRFVDVPELALGALDRVGQALTAGYDNPFPRLDSHDAHLDEWLHEITYRLNNNEDSDFYYKRWM